MANEIKNLRNSSSKHIKSTTSGDPIIDDLVNDLEIEAGFYINPSIFAL